MKPTRALLIALAVCSLVLFSGCSDTTEPPTGDLGDGYIDFEGQIDPAGNAFILKTLDIPHPDGVPVQVQLIGRFVREGNTVGDVSLAVAIKNIDRRTLYAPAEVILGQFNPRSVQPTNADWTTCPNDSSTDLVRIDPFTCRYGYVYSRLLGDDGMLTPGETSGERVWSFHNPEGVSFSFAAHARFGMQPDRPAIAGLIYNDANRNGRLDDDELPFGGTVRVMGPGIEELYVSTGDDGRYSVPIQKPGLYNLMAIPPPTLAPFAPVVFTTPNPLEVVILETADGVQSFLHADFGVANLWNPDFPPIQFVESTDRLTLDHYRLLGLELEAHTLHMRVGYSGCGPEHPLQLFMVGGFMESMPVQARLLLDHNSLGEMCDAYWEESLRFDLTPIFRLYASQYNAPPEVIILNFEDWEGTVHKLELRPEVFFRE